jgi:uncharacterized protein (DUF342 family)
MSTGSYTITLGNDDMVAWICFNTDAPVSLTQLQDDLAAADVVYGIDQFLLADLAEAHQPGARYCIARGLPPDDGLEYGFSLSSERTPQRLEDGRVDFHNLNAVQNVLQQQVLVTKLPPAARKAGRTVRGADVPPPYHDVPLPQPGSHVALSADATSLVALTNGYPVFIDNVLSVETSYMVDGDVDFTTGNLTCVGHVVVSGDVKNHFSIKGAQDVTIHGVTDGGTIDAGGSMYLYGNVFGQHKSHITSASSIHATYIDAATVRARKDIILTRGTRHSDLYAGGSVLVQGDEGHIIGGTIRAHRRILAHNLGSERAIPTQVEILPGAYDTATSTTFLAFINAIIEDDKTCLAQGLPSPKLGEHVAELRALLHQGQHAVRCLSTYLHKRQQLLPIMPLQSGTVVATGTVHPGVTVCIGHASFRVREPLMGVMFYKVNNAIHMRALEETNG